MDFYHLKNLQVSFQFHNIIEKRVHEVTMANLYARSLGYSRKKKMKITLLKLETAFN